LKDKAPHGKSHERGPVGPLFFEAIRALKEDPFVSEVSRISRKMGLSLYLVGGAVRNIFLQRPLGRDYDFVCRPCSPTGSVPDLAHEAARVLGGVAFVLDRKNGLYRVAIRDHDLRGRGMVTLDFLPLRYPSIDDDLLGRDFTINAMAVDFDVLFRAGAQGSDVLLLDPAGGAKDCELRLLRLVSDDALAQDPLRALRAVRLSIEYGLRIDAVLLSRIKKEGRLLVEKRVAGERIGSELALVLKSPRATQALALLQDLGLLHLLLPLPAVDPGKPLCLSLLEETTKVINNIMDENFRPRPLEMKRCLERGAGPDPIIALKLSAFFIDSLVNTTGAPKKSALPSGRAAVSKDRAFGEGTIGSAIKQLAFGKRNMGVALKNLAFGKGTIGAVKGLVSMLCRWRSLPDHALSGPAFVPAFFHLVERETRLAPPMFFVLAMADEMAGQVHSDNLRLKSIKAMIRDYYGKYREQIPAPLFTGDEIMKSLGVSEGRMVGLLKKKLEDALLTGLVTTRQEALLYMKKLRKV